MNYKQYITSLFFVSMLFSCEENDASGPGANAVRPSSPILPATPTSNSVLPINEKAVINTAAAKLNPAHGEPGHRCDIAVGAPLTQNPSSTLNSSQPASPILNTSLQTTPATQTKPVAAPLLNTGINPAHGQPGHRCDVAVGAAIPKTSAPLQNSETPNSPLLSPSADLNSENAAEHTGTTNKPGLNPAHGQPGHRCDIAVGQPLNEEAKKN